MRRFLHYRLSGVSNDGAPVPDINTTPLIDVMLVLLVMFIITIPLQSHAVKLDLPGPVVRPPPPDAVRNRVVVTADGRILWNGAPVTRQGLEYNLALVAAMEPQPELHLEPDATARYAAVDEVLAITKRADVRRMGFVGNERYRDF